MNTISFNEAVCKGIRTQLDHYLSNELSVETDHEVMKHLEACAACSTELEGRMRVKNLLRRAVQSETAPPALQQRIEGRIRASESSFSLLPFSPRWALAAAAAVVVALGGVMAVRWRTNRLYDDARAQAAYIRAVGAGLPRIETVGLADHLHCAVFRRFPKEYPAEAVAVQQLGPQFVQLVSKVKDRMPGEYRVVMAHRCSYAGRHYVHFVLKSDSNLLSLVITEKQPGESFSKMEASSGSEVSVPVYEVAAKRFEVAGFESEGYLAFIVSDLDRKNNLQIAQNLAPLVAGFLNSING
jgi:mycothiol system anti-sigma-R factor